MEGEIECEFGIVVHCWFEESIGCHDCLVVMFGEKLPTGEPKEKPVIFRYAAIGLHELPLG